MQRPPLNNFTQLGSTSIQSIVAGPTITPGNNTYGAYAQLLSGASVTDDAYGILINVSGVASSGVAKDALAKVGLDPGGGSSYVDAVTDLQVSSAISFASSGGGIAYFFPLRVRAGTSIAVAVSVNNATVGTCSAYCRLSTKPSHPHAWRSGSFVRTIGSTPASSSGTAVTPGNAAEGTFVQVGSALTESLWGWCLGVGVNNAVLNNNPVAFDLAIGDATNKRIVVLDQMVYPTVNESLTYFSYLVPGQAAVGDFVYVRAAGTGAPVTGWSAVAYGMGG